MSQMNLYMYKIIYVQLGIYLDYKRILFLEFASLLYLTRALLSALEVLEHVT